MTNLEGHTFAGYEILAKLGEGGMGAVYKAREPQTNRLVALKLISREIAHDKEFIARFEREAAAAAQLDHPIIAQFYAAGESEGSRYIACEFIDGEPLSKKLERRGRLDPREALAICVYICEALHHAWQRARLVHRDVTPDNVLISKTGEVKIADLGIAKNFDAPSARITQAGKTVGTPHYMSPEQARGETQFDFRSDIFSVGCVLFRMLTGRPPYEGKNDMDVMMQQICAPVPPVLKIMPECPRTLAMLLVTMLEKNPDDRPASYEQLIAEMTQIRDGITEAPTV